MGSYLPHLRRDSFRPLPIKRLSAYFPTSIRGYTNSQPSKESDGHRMERARTTAEEFERVAEEFEKVAEAKAHQETIGKAHNGKQEAAAGIGDSRVESAKEKYEEEEEPVAVGKGHFQKTGDE